MVINSSGKIKFHGSLFIFKHIGYFLLTSIICVGGPIFIMAFLFGGRRGVRKELMETKAGEKIIETTGTYYDGFNSGVTQVFMVILAGIITTYLAVKNLKKFHIKQIQKNSDKLILTRQNVLGKTDQQEIMFKDLSFKIWHSQKRIKKISFLKSNQDIATIKIDNIYWNVSKSIKISKLVDSLNQIPKDIINLNAID